MTVEEAIVRLGDVGTRILITFLDGTSVLPLDEAISISFIFKKPDNTCVAKDATLFTDGTDGKANYLSETGFFDQVGEWAVQGYATFQNGAWYTTIGFFPVGRRLCKAALAP